MAWANIKTLYERSQTFREELPRELKYLYGLENSPSGLRLGVGMFSRDPLNFLEVLHSSLADRLGFQSGDRIVGINGQASDPTFSLEDFKLLVKANIGHSLLVDVVRNGQKMQLKVRVPKELPKEAILTK